MAKYKVVVSLHAACDYVVEANDEDEAREIAEEIAENDELGNFDFMFCGSEVIKRFDSDDDI